MERKIQQDLDFYEKELSDLIKIKEGLNTVNTSIVDFIKSNGSGEEIINVKLKLVEASMWLERKEFVLVKALEGDEKI